MKPKHDDWAEPYDQPIRDLVKQTRSQLLKELRGEVERMKLPGDFAGAGTMKLLGMTPEDVTHDVALQNEAYDDVIKLLEKYD